jgi:hypothetical protein
MLFVPNLQSTDRVSCNLSIDMPFRPRFSEDCSESAAIDQQQATSAKTFSDTSSFVDRSELKATGLHSPVAEFDLRNRVATDLLKHFLTTLNSLPPCLVKLRRSRASKKCHLGFRVFSLGLRIVSAEALLCAKKRIRAYAKP